jgi:hypothetical protein
MANTIRNLALDHILEHRLSFENSFGNSRSTLMVNDQRVADNGIDSMMGKVPAVGMERDALDSALDPDLDSYCKRMRSEIAQGDELTIRAAAGALQINIRILKLNSSTMTIMALVYPGTPPNLEEIPDIMNAPASDAQDLRTITIAHYVHQHEGAGHYNPIFHQDESELGLEDMDTVDDEEDPDSGRNEQGQNSEPAAISVSGDIEEAKSQDYRRNSGANERAVETMESKTGPQQLQMAEGPLVTSVIMDIEEGSKEEEHLNGRTKRG